MKERKIFSQLFVSSIIIICSLVIALSVFSSNFIRDFYFKEKASDLKSRAYLVSQSLSDSLLTNSPFLTKYCQKLSKNTGMRITIIHDSGKVVGDSHESPNEMDNHIDRPEVFAAFQKGIGTSERFSYTLNKEMLYLAIPINFNTNYILRTSIPITTLQENISSIRTKIYIAGLVIIILSLLITGLMAKRISNPIEAMKKNAKEYAHGNFTSIMETTKTTELNSLIRSMNEMAQELENRIQTITQERNEREVILSSMVEGVLAVDTSGEIFSINKAMSVLFNIDTSSLISRNYTEIFRHSQLIQFIQSALIGKSADVWETNILKIEDKILSMTSSLLIDNNGVITGAVFVFNEITQMQKLIELRKEFVSNVSHELKTPITAIQGFIETLRDVTNSNERIRFYNILSEYSDRMNSIIDDLLKLSKIEQQKDTGNIEFQLSSIKTLLENVVKEYRSQDKTNKNPLLISLKNDIEIKMNSSLMQQAVENLIDNAIKYSEAGNKITLKAEHKKSNVLISVTDSGCGISEEHFPRLFERFYRVDKGRSRQVGGTGLGLSIVKHIVQAHNGSVDVISEVNVGSTFKIIIPV